MALNKQLWCSMANVCENHLTVLGTPTSVNAFVRKVVNDGVIDIVESFGADGIDIDHEDVLWDIDTELVAGGPFAGLVVFAFHSRHIPPIESISRISFVVPDLLFGLDYVEPGLPFLGATVLRRGSTLFDEYISEDDFPDERFAENEPGLLFDLRKEILWRGITGVGGTPL